MIEIKKNSEKYSLETLPTKGERAHAHYVKSVEYIFPSYMLVCFISLFLIIGHPHFNYVMAILFANGFYIAGVMDKLDAEKAGLNRLDVD
jgi:hypothetical protein